MLHGSLNHQAELENMQFMAPLQPLWTLDPLHGPQVKNLRDKEMYF